MIIALKSLPVSVMSRYFWLNRSLLAVDILIELIVILNDDEKKDQMDDERWMMSESLTNPRHGIKLKID